MGKVKKRLQNLPIMPTFILLMILFVLAAIVLAEFERTALINAQRAIAFQYSDIVAGFNDIKVWSDNAVMLLSEQDSGLMRTYELLLWILPPLTYIICSCAAGIIFFRSKIKQPVLLLSSSADRIAANDLDFSLHYDKDDEMGTLCAAFEKMRSALDESNREMWRQMGDKKRLNAAFSHDLRTPLTVLEGHLNILQKYAPEDNLSLDDTLETYGVMLEQIERLKNYISAMNTLQRLEDIPIEIKSVKCVDFLKSLNDTAAIVCGERQLVFESECDMQELSVDPEIVMQVFENLLSNAVRYANNSISVICKVQKGILSICVADDGNGFDNRTLKAATDPFFTTDKKETQQHFGLGLNICKILCERHNGNISLCNGTNGGAVVTVSFQAHTNK